MNFFSSLLFIILLTLSSCNINDSKEIIWRVALEEIQGSLQDQYAQEFKKIIEKKSKGKIKVLIYPYGTLGTSDQITELVATGAIQFTMASPGHLGKIIPELQIFLLHYLFSSNNKINQHALDHGQATEIFKKLYREKGFHLLSFYPEGWQVWSTKKPITKPEDFKGFKMRVMTSPLLLKTYKAYGALAVPMPYGEIYSGLQLNMIDGQVNPVFAIEEMSFYEVTDYLIFPQSSQFITSFMTSQSFLKRLDEKQIGWIQSSVSEISDFIFEKQKEYNQDRLRIIQEKKPDIKLIKLSTKQKQAFETKSKALRKVYLKIGGSKAYEVLEAFKKDLEIASKLII